MKCTLLTLFFIILSCFSYSFYQTGIEEDIDIAYQNAKKGIYWALNNIPEKKAKIENDLIAEDKLYASIQMQKEVNGIKIESTGFNHSNSVSIKIYKSYDSLIKEGYLKKIPAE